MTWSAEGRTMRTLLILRHAKASGGDPDLDDYDRPLNERGRKEAKAVGKLMRARLPDLVLTSPAVRTRETVALWQRASRYQGPIEERREFYLAGPYPYLEALAQLGTRAATTMVVGHNPGLEELVHRLTGRHEVLPPAALAEVELSADSWDHLARGVAANLVGIRRVKEPNVD
ncbi:MAG TPA: histidine phosphatase family protein [Polyangiaceae bacterium]|nr:histidine phosphatase family protein [Polyangiaceae bacterium]